MHRKEGTLMLQIVNKYRVKFNDVIIQIVKNVFKKFLKTKRIRIIAEDAEG